MELNRIFSRLQHTEEYRRGLFKFGSDSKGLFLQPTVGDTTKRFRTFGQMQQHMRQLAVKSETVWDAALMGRDKPSAFPRMGGLPYQEMEALAESVRDQGMVVRRTSFSLHGIDEARNLLESDGETFGMLIPSKDALTAIQITKADGTSPWTAQKVMEQWETIGLQFEDVWDDKFNKRMRAYITPRLGLRSSERFKVGVYDPQAEMAESLQMIRTNLEAQGATPDEIKKEIQAYTKHASDGQALAPPKTFRRFRDEIYRLAHEDRRKAAALRKQAGGLVGEEARALRAEADELEHYSQMNFNRANHLSDIANRGSGIFQFRVSGMDVGLVGRIDDPELAGLVEDLNSSGGLFMKGAVRVTLNPAHADHDFVTSVHNISRQVGHVQNAYAYIDELPGPDTAHIDIQSIVSQRELFDVPGMQAEQDRKAMAYMDEIQRTGDLPADLRAALERDIADQEQAIKRMGDAADPDEIRRLSDQTAYGRRLLEAVGDGRKITDDPGLLRLVLESYQRSLVRTRTWGVGSTPREFPNWLIQDSLRAEISTQHLHNMSLADPTQAKKLGLNEVSLDPRSGTWTINDMMAYRTFRAGGGWDLDDAFVMMARWDEHEQRIDMPAYRNPDARGELHFYQMRADDHGADLIMAKRVEQGMMPQEILDQFRTAVQSRDTRQVNDILSAQLLRTPENPPSTLGFDRAGNWLGPGINAGADPGITYIEDILPPDPVAKEAFMAKMADMRVNDRNAWFKALNAEQWAKGERAAANNTIGIWTNSITFFNEWYSRAQGSLVEAGLKADVLDPIESVVMTEKVIDLSTSAGKGGEEIIKRAQRKIFETVRGATIAQGLGMGPETKLDPFGFKWLASRDMNSWEEGLAAGNKYLRQLAELGGVADPGFLKTKDILLTDDELANGILAQASDLFQSSKENVINPRISELTARFPDFITNAKVASVNEDAQWLIQQYRASRRLHAADELDDEVLHGLDNKRIREIAVHYDTLQAATKFFDPSTGEAGEYLSRVITRAKQLIQDEPARDFGGRLVGPDYNMFSQWVGTLPGEVTMHKLSLRADDWARPIEDKVVDALGGEQPLARFTYEDVAKATGRASIYDPGISSFLDEALGTEPGGINRRMLENLSRVVDDIGPSFDLSMVPEAENIFAPTVGRARIVNMDATGPMNPRAIVDTTRGVMYMDQLWKRAQAGEEGMREALRQSTHDYYENMRRLVEEVPELDADLTRRMAYTENIRAGLPGEEKARRARAMLDEASEVAGPKSFKSGVSNFVRDMWSAKYGRRGMMGAAAFAAIGVASMIRDKDRTLNEMQGPAFLPGGNPYDEENSMQFEPMDVSQYQPQRRGGGTTYQVNLRGAQDNQLVQTLAGIIGGDDVRTNQYTSRDRPRGNAYDRAAERY